ncbi:hypothetical protein EZS27_041803, partial [termite gut metagenome]
QRKLLLEATRRIRALSRMERYEESLELIRTVPCVGFITGMTFLTEIEDISRFANSDKLAGYIGLIPTSHASGEKEGKGEMTFRGTSANEKHAYRKFLVCPYRPDTVNELLGVDSKDGAKQGYHKDCQKGVEQNLLCVEIQERICVFSC